MKFPLSRYRIIGHSMEPTLTNGQVVWVNNWAYLFSKPQKNHVIVATLKNHVFVKRIKKIDKDSVYLVGDNLIDSLDSRELGSIKLHEIQGKVIL